MPDDDDSKLSFWPRSVTSWVALLTSVTALLASVFGVVVYFPERAEKSGQQQLENQIIFAQDYFSRFGPDSSNARKFCDNVRQAKIYAEISGEMASIPEEKIKSYFDLGTEIDIDENKKGAGLRRVVKLIAEDIRTQNNQCLASLDPATTQSLVTNGLGGAYVAPGTITDSSSAAIGSNYIVYIQYDGSVPGKALASKLQADIGALKGFSAPGLQRVKQVPKQDQIRIFDPSLEASPTMKALLEKNPELTKAKIVDFSKAYPDASKKIIEIWLSPKS